MPTHQKTSCWRFHRCITHLSFSKRGSIWRWQEVVKSVQFWKVFLWALQLLLLLSPDTAVKQNLNSLVFLRDTCNMRLKRLQEGTHDLETLEVCFCNHHECAHIQNVCACFHAFMHTWTFEVIDWQSASSRLAFCLTCGWDCLSCLALKISY